jgi:hypothetical protein
MSSFPNCLLPSGFPKNNLNVIGIYPMHASCLPIILLHSILFVFFYLPEIYLQNEVMYVLLSIS